MSFDNSYSNQPVNGFKISVFFNAAPGSDFSVEARRVLVRSISYGRTEETVVEGDNSIQPMNAYVERISAVQYKAVFDYSNVTIPARGRYPADGMIRLRSYNTTYADDPDNWMPYGHTLRGYVIESPSGEVLTTSVGGYTPDPLRRIGVLTDANECPDADGTNTTVNEITLDVEDSGNQTSIAHLKGTAAPIGVQLGGTTIRFRYCTLLRSELPRTPYGYAVLKMDSECPAGSRTIIRTHDTEDSGNIDAYSGYIWPNSVRGGGAHAVLHFCYVPSQRGSTVKYPFAKKYGIFANPRTTLSESVAAVNEIFIDDENNGNQNAWNRRDIPEHLSTASYDVMEGSTDTKYRVLRWVGSESAMLAKNADVAQTGNIAVENTLVAAAPLAPAVKGLNRDVVAVELKSAGDVRVSIVGVNGAVIANVSEKNLQAGVHQIKWNAGMAPSGRYIVKIEQNGMVNAKNVILK